MFNPFASIDPRYLPAFKQRGVIAFVKQTYERGRNLLGAPDKPSFLLAHYNEMHIAKNHYDTIAHDPERKLLMVDNIEDWHDLLRLSGPESGAYVYVYLKVKDAELKAKKILDRKLHAYIDHKLAWRPGRSTVHFDLEFTFGEIYVVLKLGAVTHKVKIEDIESMKGYVL